MRGELRLSSQVEGSERGARLDPGKADCCWLAVLKQHGNESDMELNSTLTSPFFVSNRI